MKYCLVCHGLNSLIDLKIRLFLLSQNRITVHMKLCLYFSGGISVGFPWRLALPHSPSPPPPPTDYNFLNFMQFFGNFGSWRMGAPSYGEYWIRYCIYLQQSASLDKFQFHTFHNIFFPHITIQMPPMQAVKSQFTL